MPALPSASHGWILATVPENETTPPITNGLHYSDSLTCSKSLRSSPQPWGCCCAQPSTTFLPGCEVSGLRFCGVLRSPRGGNPDPKAARARARLSCFCAFCHCFCAFCRNISGNSREIPGTFSGNFCDQKQNKTKTKQKHKQNKNRNKTKQNKTKTETNGQ